MRKNVWRIVELSRIEIIDRESTSTGSTLSELGFDGKLNSFTLQSRRSEIAIESGLECKLKHFPTIKFHCLFTAVFLSTSTSTSTQRCKLVGRLKRMTSSEESWSEPSVGRVSEFKLIPLPSGRSFRLKIKSEKRFNSFSTTFLFYTLFLISQFQRKAKPFKSRCQLTLSPCRRCCCARKSFLFTFPLEQARKTLN